MKEAYVSYEVAKLLKQKGFDWECRSFYEYFSSMITMYQGMLPGLSEAARNYNKEEYRDICSRPTQQMACRWLREVHNIDIWVRPHTGIMGVKCYTPYITTYKLRTKGHMYYHEDAPDRYDSKDHFIPVPGDKGLIPAHQHYNKHEETVEAALEYVLTKLI